MIWYGNVKPTNVPPVAEIPVRERNWQPLPFEARELSATLGRTIPVGFTASKVRAFAPMPWWANI